LNKKYKYGKSKNMSLKKIAIDNLEYNYWANEKFVKWLQLKPDELLHQEFPSSFTSIIKTVNHIWTSQEIWWSILGQTTDFVDTSKIDNLISSQIFDGLINNSIRLIDHFSNLTEQQLAEHIALETPLFKCDMPKYDYLQHVVNHGTYHRGQIVTIGRNIGIVDAPMTDYNIFRGRF
jgi:uncharacterized damage-inducible protein DinB